MAKQNSFFVNFYEKAWMKRRAIMEECISSGDHDPLSVIYKFRRKSSRFGTTGDGEDVEIKYPENVSLLPTGKPIVRQQIFLDKYHPGPWYADPLDFLCEYIEQGKYDAIIELGAGYGGNLVEIFYRGGPRGIPYLGGELTGSGRQAIQMLADLKPEMNLRPFFFDHKNPVFPEEFAFKKVFIFTCHSIEQVTEIPDDYFKVISQRFEQICGVHLEPFGFQIEQFGGEANDFHMNFFIERQWNMNFIRVFWGAADRHEIEEIFMAKNIMGGPPETPTSLAVWQSPPSSKASSTAG